jgi:DNA-directed RNA polymerase specialized sigma24 family protein
MNERDFLAERFEEHRPHLKAVAYRMLGSDSVGLALLVVLESLNPAERLAFVLHDMFGMPFEEIAPIVDGTPFTARKLAGRARQRVRGAAPVPDPDPDRLQGLQHPRRLPGER